MTNPDVFTDPTTFKPERWLESTGKYLTTRPAGFVTFGMGRRVCLGEKLALADLFLMIVRILQATAGHQFVLPGGEESASIIPDPKNQSGCVPFNYKLILRKV
jgi:cytochrome P450